jgi:hypothetical protein
MGMPAGLLNKLQDPLLLLLHPHRPHNSSSLLDRTSRTTPWIHMQPLMPRQVMARAWPVASLPRLLPPALSAPLARQAIKPAQAAQRQRGRGRKLKAKRVQQPPWMATMTMKEMEEVTRRRGGEGL